jgi:hypothetical protein
MAIKRALRVKLPWKVKDAGVILMELSHKLAHSKHATNIEMVAKVEALPAIGMLDGKEILCYPIEDLVELVFVGPRSLALLDLHGVKRFDGTSVFLGVLERFSFEQGERCVRLVFSCSQGRQSNQIFKFNSPISTHFHVPILEHLRLL